MTKQRSDCMSESAQPVLDANRVMDVRPIPCTIKHGLILKTWHDLAVGEHFILLNNHDPVPLRHQFEAEFFGAFTWEYLACEPGEFRIKLTKHHVTPWLSEQVCPTAAANDHEHS